VVILPGVGAAADTMHHLQALGGPALFRRLHRAADSFYQHRRRRLA
jgi:imidazoleglycerol phosphate synthase glutamine amidotransferase subunit HisH